METKMAQTYAILSLAYFEENQYEIIGSKNIIKKECIKSWKRYADDCFMY